MAGGMEDLGRIGVEADTAAVCKGFVGWGGFWRIDTNPGRLFGHDLEHGKVVFVEKDGCAGEGLELECSADVVDVGVGDKDLLEGESEGGEPAMDARDFIAGVNDDSFAGFLVSQDCAVALEWADRKGRPGWACLSRFDKLRYLPGFAGAEDAGFTSSRTECAWLERT